MRAIVSPAGRLQSFARELGARRYGARLPEPGPPETIELAQAFNATAVSLEAAEAELRRLGERHLAELDAVFREAPLGLAFVDRDLRFLRVNEELARFNGRSVAEHLGSAGQETPTCAPRCAKVIEGGAAALDQELSLNGRDLPRPATSRSATAGTTCSRSARAVYGRQRPPAGRELPASAWQHVTATLAAAVTRLRRGAGRGKRGAR